MYTIILPLQVWQAFVGVKARRLERYYQDLLADETDAGESKERANSSGVPKKWKRQIEKVIRCMRLGLYRSIFSIRRCCFFCFVLQSGSLPRLIFMFNLQDIPRTFPGHPALDENGRDSLRRLLLAYARHNPSVGYCQVTRVLKVPSS